MPDLSALLRHPTAPHLAAFILPSVGRVASAPRLAVKSTKMFAMVRKKIKPLIAASTRLISAQAGCRLVRYLMSHARCCGQSSAIPL
jgi:hypothetical protein